MRRSCIVILTFATSCFLTLGCEREDSRIRETTALVEHELAGCLVACTQPSGPDPVAIDMDRQILAVLKRSDKRSLLNPQIASAAISTAVIARADAVGLTVYWVESFPSVDAVEISATGASETVRLVFDQYHREMNERGANVSVVFMGKFIIARDGSSWNKLNQPKWGSALKCRLVRQGVPVGNYISIMWGERHYVDYWDVDPQVHFRCMKCKHEFTKDRKDLTKEERIMEGAATVIMTDCPKCGAKGQSRQLSKCPKCEKYYLPRWRVDPRLGTKPGSNVCEHCKLDVDQWCVDEAKRRRKSRKLPTTQRKETSQQ